MARQISTVGILHPGSMGSAIARQLVARGIRVLWDPIGRGAATHARAVRVGAEPVPDLEALVAGSEAVISICPPAAAEEVARTVAPYVRDDLIYVEANAVSPRRLEHIVRILHGSTVLDAAVVGSPPGDGKRPRLYMCGPSAPIGMMCDVFADTDVDVRSLGPELGKASALKLAYTSYQKAARVLAAVAYATAEANGVGDELLDIAALRPRSYLSETDFIPTTAALAWRWGPELVEAADLLEDSGFPPEMMRAAAQVLHTWADVHDARLDLDDVIGRLKTAR